MSNLSMQEWGLPRARNLLGMLAVCVCMASYRTLEAFEVNKHVLRYDPSSFRVFLPSF